MNVALISCRKIDACCERLYTNHCQIREDGKEELCCSLGWFVVPFDWSTVPLSLASGQSGARNVCVLRISSGLT